MFISFTIYSFLGYIMESLYVSLLGRKWISSGLLKGPYIPLYGIGAITLIEIAPLLHNKIICFFVGGMIMTLIEYLASFYIEKVFHKKCWDYSHLPFHYQGRICLFYFIIWCFLSIVLIHIIHPYILTIIPYNDLTLIFSLIFLTIVCKDFIEQINHSQNKQLLNKKIVNNKSFIHVNKKNGGKKNERVSNYSKYS